VTRPQQLAELTLRIAAALALVLAPWVARADEELCGTSAVPQIYTEMETSLGTMGLCLIYDESEDASDEAKYLTQISKAFVNAARRGVFDNSFFHRGVACPDLVSCSAVIHGGSFRLAAGEISDPGGWWPPPDPGVATSGAFKNNHYMLSFVRSTVDENQGDWFINAQDNSDKLNWPLDAYEVFGRAVANRGIVDEIAALPTLDTSRSPSKLHVRLAENACLSGEVAPGSPEAALDDCPCPVYDAEGICIAPSGFVAPADYPTHPSVAERPLWVRDDGTTSPCIHNDQEEPEEICVCSTDDLRNGICKDFDEYLEDFEETELQVNRNAEPEPCIHNDEPDYIETCECTDEDKANGTCIAASDYPDDPSLPGPELWVRVEEDFTPCIRGDEAVGEETDPCDEDEKGVIVTAESYGATFENLQVRRDADREPCISGDEDEEDEECDCTAPADCVPFEEYLAESEGSLGVRFPISPCISGDDESELCLCDEDEKGEDGPCELFDDYVGAAERPDSLQVSLRQPARLSGDQEPDSTICRGLDVKQGRCLRADDDEIRVESLVDPSSGLWVRDEAPEPCISGDEEDEECECSETDKDDDTCEDFDTYISRFPTDVRARQEACISGDEEEAEETCACDPDDHCVDAEEYLDTRPELWVRDDGESEPCISGDQESDEDQEDEEGKCSCSDSAPCVPLDEYASGLDLPYPLFVRLDPKLCLSGDDSEDQGSCVCSDYLVETGICVRADDGDADSNGISDGMDEVYEGLPARELWVRDDGESEPCISGDELLDDESCLCGADDRQEEICVAFDSYLGSLSGSDLWVRNDGTEPCINGDEAEEDEQCECSQADKDDDICIAAETYPDSGLPARELWVRDDGESEACISGDETVAAEICICEADDWEDGTCVSFDDAYLRRVRPRNALWVRLGSEPCLSGDAPEVEGDCACTDEEIDDGTCIRASDYRDHFPLDWIRLASGEEDACINGDDDEADETCLCSSEEKNGVVCESAEDFLWESHSGVTLQVRPAIEPCFSTDDMDGDDSCKCSEGGGGCMSGGEYLLSLLPNNNDEGEETVDAIHHFTHLPIDTDSGDPSIFDIHSSGLVMIRSVPEPSSMWLQGSSVLSLALLARARRRIRRRSR
jgi:cyclophilin family peptidyl-prolyl cis-trans isomerase